MTDKKTPNHEEEVAKKIAKQREKKSNSFMLSVVGIVLGITAIILGIIAILK